MDDLQGTWAVSCTDSTTQLAIFSGTNLTLTTTGYWDETCLNASFTIVVSLNNLRPGAKTTLADGTEGYFLSQAYQSITATPLDGSTALSFNLISFCEINSWQANVASDISNKNCDGTLSPKLGSTRTGKYRISGNKLVSEDYDQQVTVYTKQ